MRKLGISYGGFKPVEKSAEEKLRIIRESGFDSIFSGIKSPEDIDNMAPKVREAGLCYEFLHAPFDRINDIWRDDECGEVMLGRLITCAETCARNEIPLMVIHLSSKENAPFANDLGTARFDRLMEETARLGVKVAIENQRKIGNICYLMERYAGLSHVGFCWDNGHEAIYTPQWEYMNLFGDRLFCVHIHDNNKVRWEDLHILPFDGEIDFNRVAELLRKYHFDGTLMLETKSLSSPLYAGLSMEDFMKRAYRRANRLRTLIDGESE